MQKLDRISAAVSKITDFLGALTMSSVACVIFAQVIMRYVFSKGIIWADQYARYFTIWTVMLVANSLVRDDELIKVDFFDSMWPKGMIRVRERLYQMLFFVLMLILLVYGSIQAYKGRNVALLGLPFSWFVPYLSIPVGAALMLFQYIVAFLKSFSKETKEDAP
ncbi:MAG: TRAP transporter small permease [Lawsonibacter sp.]|nr:TRAP transporter small permease [Lawsonibacter sp.]